MDGIEGIRKISFCNFDIRIALKTLKNRLVNPHLLINRVSEISISLVHGFIVLSKPLK